MEKLDKLWSMTREMRIFVDYAPLTSRKAGLLGLYVPRGPVILLDYTLEHIYREQKSVLAEEVGHALTFPRIDVNKAHTCYRRQGECNESIIMAQDERKALAWAADFLISDVELCQALSEGCINCHELAEYFNVSEWMVHRKLGFLRVCFRKQGLKVKGRDIFGMRMLALDETAVSKT